MLETALMCLALNIYFEARSEPIQGQIAIAEVTLNRVASPDYPNDICSVVLQENKDGCQFSWWCDGKSDQPNEHTSLKTSKALAELMLEEGEYITVIGDDATHYHNDEVYPCIEYDASGNTYSTRRKIMTIGCVLYLDL